MNEFLLNTDEDTKKLKASIRKKAMDLLARREHSLVELKRKLLNKFNYDDLIKIELLKLEEQGLLSEERFIDTYVTYRSEKGFGPIRIKMELREKGVKDRLINERVKEVSFEGVSCTSKTINWFESARSVAIKKYGTMVCDSKAANKNYNERAKCSRFLNYRGFTQEQIYFALNAGD